jgi:hypothetical protein
VKTLEQVVMAVVTTFLLAIVGAVHVLIVLHRFAMGW